MTPEGYNDLNTLLRQQLQMTDKPLTCHDLFAVPEIRSIAPSANRISDYLGVMFRRGDLLRVHAEPNTGEQGRARWAYLWREKATPEWKQANKVEPKEFRPKPILDRPNLYISEDGDFLEIEMPEISIQIKIRKKE